MFVLGNSCLQQMGEQYAEGYQHMAIQALEKNTEDRNQQEAVPKKVEPKLQGPREPEVWDEDLKDLLRKIKQSNSKGRKETRSAIKRVEGKTDNLQKDMVSLSARTAAVEAQAAAREKIPVFHYSLWIFTLCTIGLRDSYE